MSRKPSLMNSALPALVLVSVLLVIVSYSEAITFERTYGWEDDDFGHCVEQTSDGGYIIVGWTESSGAGLHDVYLIKTDSFGTEIFERTYGGAAADFGNSVQQTLDGGYVLAGETWSFGAGYEDVYVVKVDSVGDTLWQRFYGGVDTDVGNSIRQTLDGGYIIAGATWSSGAGYQDVYLIKLDTLGWALWEQTYGDTFSDGGFSVQQTGDGGYIVAGWAESPATAIADVYIVKTDSSGNVVWETTHGGASEDYGRSVQQTLDGGYIVAGGTWSFGAGGEDVYLLKTDSLGNSEWERTYGGGYHDRGSSVRQTSDGGYIVAGWTESFGVGYSDIYLVRTDSAGVALWQRTYGGGYEDLGRSVDLTQDGGYVVAGGTYSFGAGYHDAYVIKTNQDGLIGIQEEYPASRAPRSTRIALGSRPNPFSNSTVISFSLPLAAHVRLEIRDVAGRVVEVLVNERREPGTHHVYWDSRENPSGIYFCNLVAGTAVHSTKMALVR